MIKVIYYHTLYGRNVELYTDKIESNKDAIYFVSGGHGYRIEHEYIKSIEIA